MRKRYDFNLKLIDKDLTYRRQGSEVDVQLTIPGTLPSTLFPFDIYIEADQLSPLVNGTYNDQMKVIKIGKRTYYVYTVRTPSTTDQHITLHFQRTRTNGTCDVTAISENFNNADAILTNDKSSPTGTRGLLTYSGISYTVPKVVPSEYRTKLEVSGVSGVTAKMASAGYVEFEGWNWNNATGNLTLTATMKLGNGTVVAKATHTVDEWKSLLAQHKTMNLQISEVTLEEKATYKTSVDAAAEAVPNGTPITVTTTESSVHPTVSYNNGIYKMTVTGLEGITRPISFVYKCTILGRNYETNSKYLSKMIDNPVINFTAQ
ncbi:hypothetical protein [Prevotella dentasini]|uniref:hypothetical protein n=1 Tax=Prevotella dentasini TaxID=589537 RepID=UPI000559E98A|nr:hypothetical protein [Prevotella dentasini]